MTMEWRDCRKTTVVEAKGPYTNPDVINTLEGQYEVDQSYIEEHGGFYLMRGADGEVYPCARDIFEETYEFVDTDDD